MNNITVIVDRVSGTSHRNASEEIEKVLGALKPLRDKGLRVRITRSHHTLVEDKVWRGSNV